MNSDEAKQYRNLTVDALRALAIGMVIVTHLLNLRPEFESVAPGLVEFLSLWNMPLLVFLSGYVATGCEQARPFDFLRRKALALLVPYVGWVLVALPVRHVPVAEWAGRVVLALVDPHAGLQMWFLWVLFAMLVLLAIDRHVHRSNWRTIAIAVAFAVLAAWPLPKVLGIDKIASLYPFLVAGYFARMHAARLRAWSGALSRAALVAFPLTVPLAFAVPAMRLPAAFAGIAFSWAVYRRLPRALLAPQAWIGRRTLGIHGWQMIALPFLIVGRGWLGAGVSTITVLAGCLLLTLGVERTVAPQALLLGRWPSLSAARH